MAKFQILMYLCWNNRQNHYFTVVYFIHMLYVKCYCCCCTQLQRLRSWPILNTHSWEKVMSKINLFFAVSVCVCERSITVQRAVHIYAHKYMQSFSNAYIVTHKHTTFKNTHRNTFCYFFYFFFFDFCSTRPFRLFSSHLLYVNCLYVLLCICFCLYYIFK